MEGASLFEPQPRGTALDHFVVQATQVLAGQKEGGFFIMIGRKPSVPSEATPPAELALLLSPFSKVKVMPSPWFPFINSNRKNTRTPSANLHAP